VLKKLSDILVFYFKKPFIAAFTSYGVITMLSKFVDHNKTPDHQYVVLVCFLYFFNAVSSAKLLPFLLSIIGMGLFFVIKIEELPAFEYVAAIFAFILILCYLCVFYLEDSLDFSKDAERSVANKTWMNFSFICCYLLICFFQPDISSEHFEKEIINFEKLSAANFFTQNGDGKIELNLYSGSNAFIVFIFIVAMLQKNPITKPKRIKN